MDTGFQRNGHAILVLLCLMFSGLIKSVSLLDMLTDGQVYVLNQGDNAILSCQFVSYSFNLFDNPILWKKTQRGESIIMNMMSNINKPFVNTNRFGVSFQEKAPTYGQELSIMNLAQEDSGNYTCEIRGPEGSILGQVTHYVFVRAYVESLVITNLNTTDIPKHRRDVTFTEVAAKANILRCVSIGGYPPPEMRVYVGRFDISDRLQWYQSPKLRGRKGLRLMTYYSERYSYNFQAEPRYDGMEITCAVNVAGYGNTNHTLATMHVNYIPIIKCFDNSAELGDSLVHLTCDVRAKPPVKSSHWVLDNNGTTMSVPSVMNEYWTQEQNRSDGLLRSTLYLHIAEARSFRSYQLVAENVVGVASHAATLIRIISKPTPRSFEQVPSRSGQRKKSNFYIYKPANGSVWTSQSRLSTLVFTGTVLVICKYLHTFL